MRAERNAVSGDRHSVDGMSRAKLQDRQFDDRTRWDTLYQGSSAESATRSPNIRRSAVALAYTHVLNATDLCRACDPSGGSTDCHLTSDVFVSVSEITLISRHQRRLVG